MSLSLTSETKLNRSLHGSFFYPSGANLFPLPLSASRPPVHLSIDFRYAVRYCAIRLIVCFLPSITGWYSRYNFTVGFYPLPVLPYCPTTGFLATQLRTERRRLYEDR